MEIFGRHLEAKSLIVNPDGETLRLLASHDERRTVFGSPSYVSEARNRSAGRTYIVEGGVEPGVQQQGLSLERAETVLKEVRAYLKDREVIQVDRTVGDTPGHRLHGRLYITKPYARIAYMWHQSLFPAAAAETPDMVSIFVPEWPERLIFVHPGHRLTCILGTDYFGESKKSFLRMAMYIAKTRGGIGLHAGSKVLRVCQPEGVIRDVGFILFGLSGTGKTTLTVHDHGLREPERVVIRQDDVVLMDAHGACYGTEQGFYIKTEGLTPNQKVLYDAAVSPNAIFENVTVAEDGLVDFVDDRLTTNGRGIILRTEVAGTDDSIDLKRADKVVFITRRQDIVPPVARLTPEQAATYFMLGESIETSAGDPTKAGQAKREVGTNPFIIGSEAEEGNRFLEILRANRDIECFLLNTGSVGEREGRAGEKITIDISTTIMKEIARNSINWTPDPNWGYEVPIAIPGVDLDRYTPSRQFTPAEYRVRIETLRRERQAWLANFPGLDPAIRID
ncbi:MAG: phosphoenolpyruvate carboxykinase (ATP) [candidate division Zixibacteria bacterium]|nr:phosphoenolpyruvate carboxykinase (ATP) [candidate division Zixibacteria bacterium]